MNICSLIERDTTVLLVVAIVICDHEYKILAVLVNSKYGGAAHVSFVWRHSAEKNLLEELYNNKNLRNTWLLGDSGYHLATWLITLYRNPEDDSMEAYFIEIHSKARCITETFIGILKAKSKILSNDRRSRYNPEKIALFVALHNVCISFKIANYTQNSVTETIAT